MIDWIRKLFNNGIQNLVNTLLFKPCGYDNENDQNFELFRKEWVRRVVSVKNIKTEYWLHGLQNKVIKNFDTQLCKKIQCKIGHKKGLNLIFCFHGNAESSYHSLSYLQPLVDDFSNKFLFILVEYPYFGNFITKDERRPTEEECYETSYEVFIDVLRLLSMQGLSVNKIYLFGRSIGTGIATWLSCALPKVDKLILIHPFMSIIEVPFKPKRKYNDVNKMNAFLSNYNAFDNFTIIDKTKARKVLIIHAKDDPLINYQHSVQLASKLSINGKYVDLWLLPDGGHGCNFLIPPELFQDYQKDIDDKLSLVIDNPSIKNDLKNNLAELHYYNSETIKYGGNYIGEEDNTDAGISVSIYNNLKEYFMS